MTCHVFAPSPAWRDNVVDFLLKIGFCVLLGVIPVLTSLPVLKFCLPKDDLSDPALGLSPTLGHICPRVIPREPFRISR